MTRFRVVLSQNKDATVNAIELEAAQAIVSEFRELYFYDADCNKVAYFNCNNIYGYFKTDSLTSPMEEKYE